MTDVGGRLLLGSVLSLGIGAFAYWRRWLTAGGVLAAVLLGTTVFGFGGWVWGGLLVAFFASSSLLSAFGKRRKTGLAEKFAKGSRRDLSQVLANGGLAGLLALGVGLSGKQTAYYPALAFAFYGALAAVNADTWSTELGVLARSAPRLITTGQEVPPGTSGGITLQGTLAALAGALFIGLMTFVLIQGAALATLGHLLLSDWLVIPAATAAGFAGALFDSLLGATVQAIYDCPVCHQQTERQVHTCGTATRLVGGWGWLDNDGVNFAASMAGALVAALFSLAL